MAGLLAELPAWYAHAACVDMDPHIFFPEPGASVLPAQRVCITCPVMLECREAGLRRESGGIWGALSEKQRRQVRRSRRV